jgi:hypothetical protein
MTTEILSPLLSRLGFGPPLDLRERTSLEGLLDDTQCCGIYVLHLTGGACYVGQSVNITQHLAQHRRTYAAIEQISILPLHRDKALLDSCEVETIRALERAGAALLNIVHASISIQSSAFDLVVPPHEQRLWVDSDPLHPPQSGAPLSVVSAELCAKTAERLARLQQRPDQTELLELLRAYLHACVLRPERTEAAFWSVSCFPSTNPGPWPRLACFSMNAMEVFVVLYDRRAPEQLAAFINLSKEVLRQTYPADSPFRWRHPQAKIEPADYTAAGLDQLRVVVEGREALRELLGDPAVLRAARLLNLHLMRKRGNLYRQYHCYALAEALLGARTGPALHQPETHAAPPPPQRRPAPPEQAPDISPAVLRGLERFTAGKLPLRRGRIGRRRDLG